MKRNSLPGSVAGIVAGCLCCLILCSCCDIITWLFGTCDPPQVQHQTDYSLHALDSATVCGVASYRVPISGNPGATRYFWLGMLQNDTLVRRGQAIRADAGSFVDAVELTVTPADHVPEGRYTLRVYETDSLEKAGVVAKRIEAAEVGVVYLPNLSAGGSTPFTITLSSTDPLIVAENSELFISDLPTMPGLWARADRPRSDTLYWAFRIIYGRSGRADTSVYFDTTRGDETWQVDAAMRFDIRGGQALLGCNSRALGCNELRSFCIRAHNPTADQAEQYIVVMSSGLWYPKYVARRESDSPRQGRYYCQFNEVGDSGCATNDIRYTPNAAKDGGFGIFQLTKFEYPGRAPNSQELWNWKQNVNSAMNWLLTKQGEANTWMTDQRGYARVAYGYPVAVTQELVGNVLFSDNTPYVIEHAVAIKKYNGAVEQYCQWDIPNRQWKFNRWQSYDRPDGTPDSTNYVDSVCSLVQ